MNLKLRLQGGDDPDEVRKECNRKIEEMHSNMQNKIQIIEEKYRQSTQVLIEEKNGQFEIQI